MANYSTDYKKIFDEEIKNFDGIKKKQQDATNKIYDSQANVLNNQYKKAVDDTTTAYENEYERNAVQKLINEKQIAERNANLGLTDSGLNRTQQTAVELSYANANGDIGLAKQNALDTLSQNLIASLSSIEQGRISSIANIDATIDSQAHQNALSRYNANVDANARIYEAEQDALAKVKTAAIGAAVQKPNVSYGEGRTSSGHYILQTSGGLLSRDFVGSLADNNINAIYNTDGTTTYIDNNSGKKTTLDSDINPYTGTRNNDVEYGVFSNGYQPDNVKGEKLKKVKDVIVAVKGNNQSVWYANGVYYVWDGANNKYQQLTRKQVYDLGL